SRVSLLLRLQRPPKVLNFGTIGRDRGWRRWNLRLRGSTFLPTARQPHNQDHQDSNAHDHQRLRVLRDHTLRLRCFILNDVGCARNLFGTVGHFLCSYEPYWSFADLTGYGASRQEDQRIPQQISGWPAVWSRSRALATSN